MVVHLIKQTSYFSNKQVGKRQVQQLVQKQTMLTSLQVHQYLKLKHKLGVEQNIIGLNFLKVRLIQFQHQQQFSLYLDNRRMHSQEKLFSHSLQTQEKDQHWI